MAVLLGGVGSAALIFVLLPSSRRRTELRWLFAASITSTAMLAPSAAFIQAVRTPTVGRDLGGALIGVWVAFVLPRRRGAPRRPGKAAPGIRDAVVRVNLGAGVGLLVAAELWFHHVVLPPMLCAPVIGVIVGPPIVVLADGRHRATLIALLGRRGTPGSRAVRRLNGTLRVAGAIGAASGAVAMSTPWRWFGLEGLALVALIAALRTRVSRDPWRPPRRPVAVVEAADVPAEWHRRRWAALAVVAGATTLLSMEHTILNVSLPTLQARLGASSSELTWVVTGFLVTYAGLLLPAGGLGDRFGRRRALRAGLFVFAASSVGCGFAASPGWLIAGRAAMGAGAAAMLPTALSTIRYVFPVEERAKAMTVWSASYGVGIALGPPVGGLVVQHLGWRWIFWGMVPLATLLLGATRLVPNSKDNAGTPVDVLGACLSFAGVTSILWAVIEAPSRGWGDGAILNAFAVGGAALTVFLAWELHAKHPLVDLTLFGDRRFSAPAGALSLVYFALMGTLFVLTDYWQVASGYTPVSAGIRMLPVAGALILVSLPAGRLAERGRLGPKLTITAGLALIAFAMFYMSTAEPGSGYTLALVSLCLAGVGLGMTQAPATTMLMGAVSRDRAGVGSAVNDTTRLIGGEFGVAVLFSRLASVYRARMTNTGAALPGRLAAAARDRVDAATAIAARIGGDAGHELHANAIAAYFGGVDAALRLAGFAAGISAVAAYVFVPVVGRSGRHEQRPSGHADDAATDAGRQPPDSNTNPRPITARDEHATHSERTPNVYDNHDWPVHLVPTARGHFHIHDTGERTDGAETAVLIAGLGFSVQDTFGHVVGSLAPRYRVVGLDNRGHGFGRRDPFPRSEGELEGNAFDLAALLRRLGGGPFKLVGYSTGGAIAQLVARENPDLVERLVLAGTAMRFGDRRLDRLNMLPLGLVDLLAPAIFRNRASSYPPVVRAAFHRGDPWQVTRFARSVGAFDSTGWAGALQAPSHVLVLENDRTVPPAAQTELAACLGATVQRLPVGHSAPAHPRERVSFVAALRDALEASPSLGRATPIGEQHGTKRGPRERHVGPRRGRPRLRIVPGSGTGQTAS
jgi:EmrB/QacA subfamily drug resistance transporter